LKQLEESLNMDVMTVNGKSLGENIRNAEVYEQDVIRSLKNPVQESGGTAILRGSLAPDGAVIKPTAAETRLWKHRGPAVVFKNYQDLKNRIDSDELEVDENSVLILQNAGPVGAPGMPEWGQLPIPKKMLEKGIRDMVRISDARMSGTSYGACILHVSPESALGSPLALVEDGDLIALDVEGRKLDLLVDPHEMERRRNQWQAPKSRYSRGFARLYQEHVSQANLGCDFDFLLGTPGETREPDIF
jgi:dihydroxy-acid dehydratase